MGITQHINGIHNAHALLNLSLVDGPDRLPGLAASRRCAARTTCRAAATPGCIPTNLPGYQHYDAGRRSTAFERGVGRAAAGRAGPRRHRDGRGLPRRARCGRCTSWARTRCSPSPTCTTRRRRSPSSTSSSCRTSSCTRRRSAPTCSCPRRPSPRRTAPSPTPSGACSACARRVPPPGEARPDWWITAELAKRVARRLGLDVGRQFDYRQPAEIFDEMARLMPVPAAASSHARLDREGGLQWPCPTRRPPGHALPLRRVVPARARALRAGASRPRRPPSCPIRTTRSCSTPGRLLYHWHGGTLTRRVEGLLELAPRLEVAMHPADARRLGVDDRRPRSACSSRRGELTGLRAPDRGGAAGRDLRPLREARRTRRPTSSRTPPSTRRRRSPSTRSARSASKRSVPPSARADSGRATTSTGETPHDVGSRDRAARAHEAHRGDRRRPRHRGGRARAVRQAQGQGHAVAHEAARGPPQRQVHRRDGDHPDAARRGQDDDDDRALDGAQPRRDRGPSRPSASRRSARSSASRAARPAAATRRSSRWRTSTST